MNVAAIAQLIADRGISTVLIAVALFLLYKLWPYIVNILSTTGERNEIIRNNTAAINNNTAAIDAVMADRHHTEELLTRHDENAKTQCARIEAKVEQACTELGKARGEIGIVKDRLN